MWEEREGKENLWDFTRVFNSGGVRVEEGMGREGGRDELCVCVRWCALVLVLLVKIEI
jgi:hypothetical protein